VKYSNVLPASGAIEYGSPPAVTKIKSHMANGTLGDLMPELAKLNLMMHYVCGYSFSRASTVMRHQPLKYSGGVMDSSRAG
jgi:hypothetical protein